MTKDYEKIIADKDAVIERLSVENKYLCHCIARIEKFVSQQGTSEMSALAKKTIEDIKYESYRVPATTNTIIRRLKAKAIDAFSDELGRMIQEEKTGSVRYKIIKHVIFLAAMFSDQLREKGE